MQFLYRQRVYTPSWSSYRYVLKGVEPPIPALSQIQSLQFYDNLKMFESSYLIIQVV